VTEAELVEFVAGLPGVAAVTASAETGAPEIAGGDTFFLYDPENQESDRQIPFATIVIKDYPGFDTASQLDRPGVFRLNIGVGRTRFQELLGYPPEALAEHEAEIDYTAFDQLIPHPFYATQGWVAVLNPGPRTDTTIRALLRDARTRAANRRRPAN
jgi:hypothetical protein